MKLELRHSDGSAPTPEVGTLTHTMVIVSRFSHNGRNPALEGGRGNKQTCISVRKIRLLLILYKPYLHLDCGLGEAPYYGESSHSLRFVDIVKEKLHTVDLKRGPSSHHVYDLGDAIRSQNITPCAERRD